MGALGETERLYYADFYRKEFSAKVIEIRGNSIALDRTCFFPEGGGQSGDSGTIGGAKVLNTQKEGSEILKIEGEEIPVGGKIFHLLESPPNFQAGEEVSCSIDWEKRFSTMRLHSASHIMEHFLLKEFPGIVRLGSKVDFQKDRGTYGSEDKFPPDRVKKVEDAINSFLSRSLEIRTFPSGEHPLLRVWECDGIRMFCGGTHVGNTEEIGKIRLKRSTKGAGKELVETFLA